jgi:iron only hydrogenase large subunit-like protein
VEPLIAIDPKKCKTCYSCVRACPVKAITVDVTGHIPVVEDKRCIGCGLCLKPCIPGAIQFRSSIDSVKSILQSDVPVIALCDPAIASEFRDISDYRKFIQMIKSIGFKEVYDESFDADLVAKAYNTLLTNFKGKYYISANCPVVVKLIEKYHPALVGNISPIVSPMIATARMVKKHHKEELRIVHIGPCIETKNEVARYSEENLIDEVITFQELRLLFNEYQVNEDILEFSDFNGPRGNLGALLPVSNGIIQAANLSENLVKNMILTADGQDGSMTAIKEFEENIDNIKRHFNLFFCKGCMMGPGTTDTGSLIIRKANIMHSVDKRMLILDIKQWNKEISENQNIDFTCSFAPDDQRLEKPDEVRITQILRSMGKEKPEDELNCSLCGFNNCREFAVAVANKVMTVDLCLDYSAKNQQNYIKSLKTTNEKLSQSQAKMKESERLAREEQDSAREAADIANNMIDKLPAGIIFINKELKVLRANRSFVDILGDEARELNDVVPGLQGADAKSLLPYTIYTIITYVINNNEEVLNRDIPMNDRMLNISVFPIRRGRMAGLVLRDIYRSDVRKEEVISRISETIDKNLEMVQQIGFLLGEGAADTERMLNSLIQSYKSGEKKP